MLHEEVGGRGLVALLAQMLSHMLHEQHAFVKGAVCIPQRILERLRQGSEQTPGRKGMPSMTPKAHEPSRFELEQQAVTGGAGVGRELAYTQQAVFEGILLPGK
jgi:hypothetical protein